MDKKTLNVKGSYPTNMKGVETEQKLINFLKVLWNF